MHLQPISPTKPNEEKGCAVDFHSLSVVSYSPVFWVVALAGSTAFDLAWLSTWERQVQTFLFDLRGPIAAPDDIIILAIDQESLSLGQEYVKTPQEYPDLEPIQTWPWKRQTYAIAIERLMAAGAKSVSIDLLFSNPRQLWGSR